MEQTKVYDVNQFQDEEVKKVVQDVSLNLDEKGYDAVNQIVGYLLSGDPGYISSYKESRKKILKLERTKILEVLVKEFLK